MVDDAEDNLSGMWMGRYEAPRLGIAPVSFEAQLTDNGGMITGLVTEPNTFRNELGPMLRATISGDHSNGRVNFRKTYTEFAQEDPIYEGLLERGSQRISGAWHFALMPSFSGRFVMMRAISAKARQQVVAEVSA